MTKTDKAPTPENTFGLKVEPRPYACMVCGHETKINTNHTAPCMNHCKECSWKSIGFGPGVRMFGTIHREHRYVGDKN